MMDLNMTDREKLLKILDDYHGNYIESILRAFFDEYGDSISASRINGLVDSLNHLLKERIDRLEVMRSIASERAIYIKTYLNGDMWATEEDTKANIQPQIDNAQSIIDVCKRC